MVTIQIRFTEAEKKKLQELAEADNRTISAYVRAIIKTVLHDELNNLK